MIHQAAGRITSDSSESSEQDDSGSDSLTRDSRLGDTGDDESSDTHEDDDLDGKDATALQVTLNAKVCSMTDFASM